MENGVFVFVIALILTVTTWFDDLLLNLRLKKRYVIMAIISSLALNCFRIKLTPELEINPAVFLLLFVTLFASLQTSEHRFLITLTILPIFTTLTVLLLNASSVLTLAIISLVASIFIGGTLQKAPCFASFLAAALPLVVYLVSVAIEITSFVPYESIDMTDVFCAQALSLFATFMSSFVVRTLKSTFAKQQ